MMLLPLLDVVFVSLVGADPGHVQKQLAMILEDNKAVAKKVAPAEAAALARHDDRATEIVKGLHVDGLVSSAIVTSGGHKTLRIVIYDANGDMRSMSETPLTGKTLAQGDLEVLHDNLGDEVGHLIDKAAKLAKKVEPAPKAAPPPPAPKKPEAKKPDPPVVAQAPMKAKQPEPELEMDEDPVGKPAKQETHEAAPVDTADVSADEIMAQTGGSETDVATTAAAPAATEAHDLHIQAGVGVGALTRSFTPGPSTIAPYSTSPVGAVRLDAHAEPVANLTLNLAFEHTLGMSTDLRAEIAPTNISRWEAYAAYNVLHGVVDVAPQAGFGHRVFGIESSDPTRTPDSTYDYLILGATVAAHLGDRVSLLGSVAFEPVVGGAEPMEMEFGSASRWALDAAAGVEVKATSHIYVRAVADYQQFSWSWDMAGARGAGGATDAYPSGTVQLGARY